MKRTVSAIILLLICAGICLAGDFWAEKYTDELTKVLEETEKDLLEGNLKKAVERITEADSKWENAEVFFSSLSDSLLVENTDLCFNSLPVYIESGEINQALVTLHQCKTAFEEIKKWQKINLKNIF